MGKEKITFNLKTPKGTKDCKFLDYGILKNRKLYALDFEIINDRTLFAQW